MQRVFKTRNFGRWTRKSGLTDDALCRAVAEMRDGLIDADLGGGIVKKRLALPGRGKRGGVRVLVATNRRDVWFFLFGFEKSERANVSVRELAALHSLAADLLTLASRQLDAQSASGAWEEICHGHEAQGGEPAP